MAIKASGVSFEEQLVPLDMANGNPLLKDATPTGKVPCLIDGDLVIQESLAILEYLAEINPSLWPKDRAARAKARAVSAEMHGGFNALRNECPMNMAREISPIKVSDSVRIEVKRIEQIWSECLACSGGPFLFGAFSNADAMFAPIVNRLEIYNLSDHPIVKAYSTTMKALPEWQEWEQAGRSEIWIVEEHEA